MKLLNFLFRHSWVNTFSLADNFFSARKFQASDQTQNLQTSNSKHSGLRNDELKMIRFSISFLLVLGFQEFVLNLNHHFRLPRKFRRDKVNYIGGETAKMRFCLFGSLFYTTCSDQVTKDNSMRGCSSSLEPNIWPASA